MITSIYCKHLDAVTGERLSLYHFRTFQTKRQALKELRRLSAQFKQAFWGGESFRFYQLYNSGDVHIVEYYLLPF